MHCVFDTRVILIFIIAVLRYNNNVITITLYNVI